MTDFPYIVMMCGEFFALLLPFKIEYTLINRLSKNLIQTGQKCNVRRYDKRRKCMNKEEFAQVVWEAQDTCYRVAMRILLKTGWMAVILQCMSRRMLWKRRMAVIQ